jgi:hypothetical protein
MNDINENRAITDKPGFKVDAAIDTQVMTARSFPRDLKKCLEEIMDIVCMDEETAALCYFTLPPRKGQIKSITGPSIRLAEICSSFWGNLQAGTRVISNNGRSIVVEGWAWDLEKNLKISKEVTKSIISNTGNQYSESMQSTTFAAATAIAFRNAIFAIIPKVFTDKAYKKAMDIAVNGINPEKTGFEKRRSKVFQSLEKYNINNEIVLSYFKKSSVEDINQEDLQEIIGIGTSIKDGFIRPEEAFSSNKPTYHNERDIFSLGGYTSDSDGITN